MYDLNPVVAWNSVTGACVVSDIVDGYRVQRTYIGYTEDEAVKEFVGEVIEYRGQ